MDAFRQKLDLEKMIREQILDGKDFVFSIPFTRQGVCKKPSAEIPRDSKKCERKRHRFSLFRTKHCAQKICSKQRVLVAACHFSTWEAESYVKDLVTATEGTRQVEMKEQAVARECMQELNEIHAAQTREDLGAEAKLNQLIRELETLAKGWAIIAVSGVELLFF